MANQTSYQWCLRPGCGVTLFLLGLALSACVLSDGHPLQSNCNQNHFEFERILNDGTKCSNFSYSDCGLPAEPVNASTIAPTIRANLTNAARMRTALSLTAVCED